MSALAGTAPHVQFRTFDGLRIRYADSGGSQERTILLTSPWPESVYAFARIWPELAQHARLFAVDLPGFGASEGRADLFSPRAMGGFLAELILDAGLAEPHILAPDVGTSAALFAAAEHPERIGGLVSKNNRSCGHSLGLLIRFHNSRASSGVVLATDPNASSRCVCSTACATATSRPSASRSGR